MICSKDRVLQHLHGSHRSGLTEGIHVSCPLPLLLLATTHYLTEKNDTSTLLSLIGVDNSHIMKRSRVHLQASQNHPSQANQSPVKLCCVPIQTNCTSRLNAPGFSSTTLHKAVLNLRTWTQMQNSGLETSREQ